MDSIDRLFKTKEEKNQALDDAYDVDVAVSILKMRIAREWTQERLAAAMDVSQTYISQLENSDVLPSHKQLKKMARIFKCCLIAPKLILPIK